MDIEINPFNKDLIEGGRSVGFTDDQINWLVETFEFREEEYD